MTKQAKQGSFVFFFPFFINNVLSSGKPTFMPGAGTLDSDLKDSPYEDIGGVMARIKSLDNFVSVRHLSNDTYYVKPMDMSWEK